MSTSVTVVCIDNNEKAPVIGADGALGTPYLESRCDYNEDWGVKLYTFGWFYSALLPLGLITEEMDSFKQFLEVNEGKRIYQFVEGGNDSHEDEVDWDNLQVFSSVKNDAFTLCQFSLSTVNDNYQCRTHEMLIPQERPLIKTGVDNFISKLVQSDMIDDSMHNMFGILDPFGELDNIRTFISNHTEQEIQLEIKSVSSYCKP